MQSSFPFPPSVLFSFLLALARVSGVVAFIPLPAIRNAPDVTKIILALSMTLCLNSVWPAAPSSNPGLVTLTLWVLSEAALGVLLGLIVSVVIESFQLAAQIFGLQAGFSYASTIDPTSQADATILQVLSQLLATCLFFTLGLHRHIIALLATSFRTVGIGTFKPTIASADAVIHFSGTMFATGLRLAFPVLALLLLIDIAIALMSRMQANLQLISLAFPVKMLAGIGFFAFTLWVTPAVTQSAFHKVLEAAAQLVGR